MGICSAPSSEASSQQRCRRSPAGPRRRSRGVLDEDSELVWRRHGFAMASPHMFVRTQRRVARAVVFRRSTDRRSSRRRSRRRSRSSTVAVAVVVVVVVVYY